MKVKRIVEMLEENQYEICLRDMSHPDPLIVLMTPEEKARLGFLFRKFDTSQSAVNGFGKYIRHKYQGDGNESQ